MDRLTDDLNAQIQVHTFGCKVNTYDSGLVQSRLSAEGFLLHSKGESKPDGPMIHVLNSCAVTAEATSQVLREARRIKRSQPDSKVVVTGCSAQVDTERLTAESEIDLVVANSHKGELATHLKGLLLGQVESRVLKSNIFKKEDVEPGGGTELGHTRSFLKIQDGCDSFCTFCVIPFARGKSRSIEPNVLARRIHELRELGVREVVLTGVHIGDYRSEAGGGLADLVKEVLRSTSIERIRLSSLEPIELSDELLELYQNDRLCRHFHMSIQSGSTSVLSRMKRNYGALEVEASLRKIAERVEGAFVGMDVIAGFPEETEEEFLETWALLRDTPWTRMHVFPYSSRPLTYAEKAYAPVEGSIIKARAARLRELSAERHRMMAESQVGLLKRALTLKSKGGQSLGLTRDYWNVQLLDEEQFDPGQEIDVLITGSDREETRAGEIGLYGKCIGRPAEVSMGRFS